MKRNVWIIFLILLTIAVPIIAGEWTFEGKCGAGNKSNFFQKITFIDKNDDSIWDTLRIVYCDGKQVSKVFVNRDTLTAPEKCIYYLADVRIDSSGNRSTFHLREYEDGPVAAVLECPAKCDSCLLVRLVQYLSFKKKSFSLEDKIESDKAQNRLRAFFAYVRENRTLFAEYYSESGTPGSFEALTKDGFSLGKFNVKPYGRGWNVFRIDGLQLGMALDYFINSRIDDGGLNVSTPFVFKK